MVSFMSLTGISKVSLKDFSPCALNTFLLEVRIVIGGVFGVAPGISTPCPALGLYPLSFFFPSQFHGLYFDRVSGFLCRGHCLVCLAAPCFRNSTFPAAESACRWFIGMEHIPSVITSRSISCDGETMKDAICDDLRRWFYTSILHGLFKGGAHCYTSLPAMAITSV